MFRQLRMTGLAMAVLLLCIGIASTGWAKGEEKAASDVVATVNGTKITRQDFNREMKAAEQYFAAMGHQNIQGDKLKEVREAVLNKLINGTLLYQASQKSGIKVDQAAVDADLAGFKGRFPDEKKYHAALAELNLTEAGVKAKIAEGKAIQQFIDQDFVNKVTVSEQSIKDYYENNSKAFKTPEQVRASHILVAVKPDADEATKKAARKKIDKIRKQIMNGGDFADFAKKDSDCPSSSKGGDLGYFSRGQMVKAFETTAFSMMPGDISDIVETQFGYHIIKLMDKKPATVVSYKDAHERIEAHLKQVEAQTKVNDYVKDVRKNAKITMNLSAD